MDDIHRIERIPSYPKPEIDKDKRSKDEEESDGTEKKKAPRKSEIEDGHVDTVALTVRLFE